MSDKSNKKPVWVDEVAHGLLKDYSAAVRRQMVEVATQLILDHVSGSAMAPAASAPAAPAVTAPAEAPVAAAPSAPAPAPEKKKPARAERKPEPEPTGARKHLGGVWLV